jgi:hypothetical protein
VIFINTAGQFVRVVVCMCFLRVVTSDLDDLYLGVFSARCWDRIGSGPRYRSEMGSVVKYERQVRLLSELIDLFLSVGASSGLITCWQVNTVICWKKRLSEGNWPIAILVQAHPLSFIHLTRCYRESHRLIISHVTRSYIQANSLQQWPDWS